VRYSPDTAYYTSQNVNHFIIQLMHNTHATQVILCRHSTDVCTTSISTQNKSCNFS